MLQRDWRDREGGGTWQTTWGPSEETSVPRPSSASQPQPVTSRAGWAGSCVEWQMPGRQGGAGRREFPDERQFLMTQQ